jgi:hypothetical protein
MGVEIPALHMTTAIHFWPHISNREEKEKRLWQGRSFDELEERGSLRKGKGAANRRSRSQLEVKQEANP